MSKFRSVKAPNSAGGITPAMLKFVEESLNNPTFVVPIERYVPGNMLLPTNRMDKCIMHLPKPSTCSFIEFNNNDQFADVQHPELRRVDTLSMFADAYRESCRKPEHV